MQLKRRPNHNYKGTPSHLSQLERNPESSTITLQEHYIITKKEPLATNRGSPPSKLEMIPLPKLERSPLAHCA